MLWTDPTSHTHDAEVVVPENLSRLLPLFPVGRVARPFTSTASLPGIFFSHTSRPKGCSSDALRRKALLQMENIKT